MGGRSLPLPNSEGHVMESVNNNFSGEAPAVGSTAENILKQKEKIQIERVTLGKDESDILNKWLMQIKGSTKGFLDLTKSDLVNFLIKSHSEDLSAKEIKKIRLSHYSLIKHLNWITPQLKKAYEENDIEQVRSLQLELRSLELGIIKGAQANNPSLSGDDSERLKKQRIKKYRNKSIIDKNESNQSQE